MALNPAALDVAGLLNTADGLCRMAHDSVMASATDPYLSDAVEQLRQAIEHVAAATALVAAELRQHRNEGTVAHLNGAY
jgi:hypothetical protein